MADDDIMTARVVRIEARQDEMAHDLAIVRSDLRNLNTRVDDLTRELRTFKNDVVVRFEHVDDRFDLMAEAFDSLRAHMDRRFDAMEQRHDNRMRLLEDVLTDHGGRIRRLEQASPRQT